MKILDFFEEELIRTAEVYTKKNRGTQQARKTILIFTDNIKAQKYYDAKKEHKMVLIEEY